MTKKSLGIIQVGNVLLSADCLQEVFACDLGVCRGTCCVEGDAGAPITLDEIMAIEDIVPEIEADLSPEARRVIADPIYARLLPDEKEKFVSMPHEAYSGRHYHDDMPIFVGPSFTAWMKEKLT